MIRTDDTLPSGSCVANRGKMIVGIDQVASGTGLEIPRANVPPDGVAPSSQKPATLVRRGVAGMREHVLND